jgi:hypothetical protein
VVENLLDPARHGKRLFAERAFPVAFTLREAKTSSRGVIVASFERGSSSDWIIYPIVNDQAALSWCVGTGSQMLP